MRNIFKLIVLFCCLNSSLLYAKLNTKIDIYPPYQNIGCSNLEVDEVGGLGIKLNGLTVKENELNLMLNINQTLRVCRMNWTEDGVRALAWIDANPFLGFEVQYFDFGTRSIQMRTEQIDANSPANRFEAAIYLEDKNKVFSERLLSSENNAGQGTIKISKMELLDQNDMDKLDTGNEVTKVLYFYSILNLTTYIRNQEIRIGDRIIAGRKLILTFIKADNDYSLKNIAFL